MRAIHLRGLLLGWVMPLLLVSYGLGETLILLPHPTLDGKVSVEQAIQQRRTVRSFRPDPLTLEQLSQLVWAAQGITDRSTEKRAAPSAGALYPLDLYVIVGKACVRGMEEGVYHYLPGNHSVSTVTGGDRRKEVALASLWQMWIAQAPVVLVVAAEYGRITGKYGDRGIRYAHIEVGHVGQNLFLQAEALGLGAGIVGAFQDGEVTRILGMPRNHEPLLIMPVGYRK